MVSLINFAITCPPVEIATLKLADVNLIGIKSSVFAMLSHWHSNLNNINILRNVRNQNILSNFDQISALCTHNAQILFSICLTRIVQKRDQTMIDFLHVNVVY